MIERLLKIFTKAVLRRLTIIDPANIPKQGGCIIVANHQGFLDAPALGAAVVANTGQRPLFPTTPWIWQWFARLIGRSNMPKLGILAINETAPGAVLNAAEQHLQAGSIIAIFPEGRRNTSNQLIKGKTGTVRLALATGAPIVPAGITACTGGVWRAVFFFLTHRPMRVVFGPPIDFTAWHGQLITAPLLDNLTEQLMKAIAKLSGKSYAHPV